MWPNQAITTFDCYDTPTIAGRPAGRRIRICVRRSPRDCAKRSSRFLDLNLRSFVMRVGAVDRPRVPLE